MKVHKIVLLMFLSLLSPPLFAQEKVDRQIISRIKEEGFQHSKVMETLSWLSDVYGPRLFASPEYREAAEWAKGQLEKYGLKNVKLEPLDGNFRGWSAESFSIEMIEPKYTPIFTFPKPYTSSTDGEVIGNPFIMKLKLEHGAPNLDSLQKFHGKLKGKIVFWDRGIKPVVPNFKATATRFTDEQLLKAGQQIDPIPREYLVRVPKKNLTERMAEWRKADIKLEKMTRFFIDEGVSAMVIASNFTNGILHVDSYDLPFLRNRIKAVPTFVISNEQFSRITRMKSMGINPVLKLHLNTTFFEEKKYAVNIIGEIPGSDARLRNEIVLMGAHFDTWSAGTGATDNGAGSAVVMEVVRILKTLGLKPRRTIRFALWAGEEQEYYGSRDYVEKRVGNIASGKLKTEPERISGYFNVDGGSGQIRGIYLQGNEAVRPVFDELLQPFSYLGATTLAIQNKTSTDHVIFNQLNVPAFQFIQDQLNYYTVTHHTNLDVYDYALEDDLKKNAVIVASVVYHVAMRDEI
jgi:Peptidase family M28